MPTVRTQECPMCHEESLVEMTAEQYSKFRHPSGPHIQEIFPEKSAGERELLITGTHPACWEKMFGEEEY